MSPKTRPDPLADNSARDFRNPGARARALEAAARARFTEQLAAERRAAELDTPAPDLAALHVEKLHHGADRLLAMLDAEHAPAAGCFTLGPLDKLGTLAGEPPAQPCLTVYAVALVFAPRYDNSAVDPIVIVRQFIRHGFRPIDRKEAATQATRLEVENWKPTRPPLEMYGPPTCAVSFQIVPAFS